MEWTSPVPGSASSSREGRVSANPRIVPDSSTTQTRAPFDGSMAARPIALAQASRRA